MKRPRRHRYSFSDIIRAAYLAGSGASAPEIAESLRHNLTANGVRGLLFRHGLRLAPKMSTQTAFVAVVSREAMTEIERIAEPFGADPHFVAARLLERAARESVILSEIVKENAEP